MLRIEPGFFYSDLRHERNKNTERNHWSTLGYEVCEFIISYLLLELFSLVVVLTEMSNYR